MKNNDTAGEALDLNKSRAEFEAWAENAAIRTDLGAWEAWQAARRSLPVDAAAAHPGLMAEIDCLKHRIAVMQNDLNMRHAKDTGDVWYWQGDGSDDPASMVNTLTVVINACDLRAALARAGSAAPTGQQAELVARIEVEDGQMIRIEVVGDRVPTGVYELRAAMSAAQAQPKDTTDTTKEQQ